MSASRECPPRRHESRRTNPKNHPNRLPTPPTTPVAPISVSHRPIPRPERKEFCKRLVKHLRSVEAAGGTTRVKSHRNRPPRALALLPEPVGVLPPSRATVRSWQFPCRAIRGFVGWRRMFHVKYLQSVERAARTTLVKSRRDHRPLAVALLTEPARVFLSSLAAMRSWQSPPLAIRSFVDRRRMFHVKHLRSGEAAGETTRVKSHRNRPPRALALLPEPVGVLPPSRATVRSWQSPCRAIRGFVVWRRMFHVKHPRSVEDATGTTRFNPRRNRRPRAPALLPEPVGAFPSSLATMQRWQSPSRAIRGFVDRRRMSHVKYLRSVEVAAEASRVESRRNCRDRGLALPPERVGSFLPSRAARQSWPSPRRTIRGFVHWCRVFHVKHLRPADGAAGTNCVKPPRNYRPGALALRPQPAGVPAVACGHAELVNPMLGNSQFRRLAQNVSRETTPARRLGRANEPCQTSSQASPRRTGPAARTGQRFPALADDHAELANPVPGNSQSR